MHGPQEADFFCIICVFKNAYYNVGFDVFNLKKSFMWFCWRVMDEIRKIGKLLKKKIEMKKRDELYLDSWIIFVH